VARLNPNSSLDPTFDADGRQTVAFDLGGSNGELANSDGAGAVASGADGRIVVGGAASRAADTHSADSALVRLNPDGGLDPTFDADGKLTVDFAGGGTNGDFATALVLQSDRKIVPESPAARAPAGDSDFAVARLLGDDRPPEAVADTVEAPAGTPVVIDVLADDAEPDGGPVAVAIDTPPANGTAVANADGTVTDTPTPTGRDGTDTFVYRLDDSRGGFATAAVTVSVIRVEPPPPSWPPVADDDAFVAPFETAVTLAVLANDAEPDRDPVTVTVATGPAHGTATVGDDGVITYTPDAGFVGDDVFIRLPGIGRWVPAQQARTDRRTSPGNQFLGAVSHTGSTTAGGLATAKVALTVEARRFALARELFGVGLDRGGDGTARLQNPDQTQRFAATPFPGSAAAGVRTATADFNGDGVADLVVGTGPGGVTRVRVLDGKTQQELFGVQPFEDRFDGGVYVAAGDIDGDGVADLVISPDEGGGPRVRVFSGNGFGQIADFFGIEDTAFRGGARSAIADLNGDGVGDRLVAAGFGGGPRVAAFNGAALGPNGGPKLFGDFLAFEDVNGDGFADLVTGAGPGGGPRVRAFDGKALVQGGAQADAANFFGGDTANRGGIRVAAKDLDGDGRADILAGAGPGGGSRVTAYRGSSVTPNGTPDQLFAFDAQAGFSGGVFVG